MAQERARRFHLMALGALLLVFWAKWVLPPLLVGRIPTDFLSFYFSARVFPEGIYDAHTLQQMAQSLGVSAHIFPYLYPPLLAFYLSPLAYLPPMWAARAWTVVLALALIPILWYTVGLVRGEEEEPLWPWAWAGLFLFLLPFDNNVRMGQVNLPVLAFIVVALYTTLRQGRAFWGGVALAAAALVKLMPAVLLLYFLIERRYRALVGFLAGGILFSLPTFLGGGGRAWGDFGAFSRSSGYARAVPGLFGPAAEPNFSLAGLWARFLGETSTAAVLTLFTLAVLLALLLFVHLWRGPKGMSGLLLLAYVAWMIMAAPYAYLHHVVYLFPVAVLTFVQLRSHPRGALVGGLLFIALVGASVDWPAYYRYLPVVYTFVPLTLINLYALLLIFVVSLWATLSPSS